MSKSNMSSTRNPNTSQKYQFQVKENAQKGVYVENLIEHKASSIEEAYVFMLYGLQRKKMFATVKNQESSRSHTLFQLKLVSKKIQTSTSGILLP